MAFHIRDKNLDIDLLKKAADTNPADPRVKQAIEMKILDLLDLDEEQLAAMNATPAQSEIQEQLMTGDSNQEIQQNIPGTTEQDIVAAAAAAALEN
jgi:predicted regulator of Ras-like GTPase activity (Roadblock/LC7/MglB family)